MKLTIYLDTEGMERIALGSSPWTWNFNVQEEGKEGPKGSWVLGEVEVTYPTTEQCVQPVLEMLSRREAEINANAHTDLRGVQERRQNLLALPFVDKTL